MCTPVVWTQVTGLDFDDLTMTKLGMTWTRFGHGHVISKVRFMYILSKYSCFLPYQLQQPHTALTLQKAAIFCMECIVNKPFYVFNTNSIQMYRK